jgi:hypothetical protein
MDSNDQGQVVGFSVGGDNIARGFFMDDAGFHPVITPGHEPTNSSYVTTITETGFITVYSAGTWYRGRPGVLTPIVFPGGGTLGQVRGANNRGDLVGTYVAVSGQHVGFILRGGRVTTIAVPGADATEPHGVNDRGDIVGRYYLNGEMHAFLAKA